MGTSAITGVNDNRSKPRVTRLRSELRGWRLIFWYPDGQS
jgi:hypothetical protein